MKRLSCISMIMVFGTLSSNGFAEDLREKQSSACMGDALRLCSQFIPSEERITSCMEASRSQLSSACRSFFVADSKPSQGLHKKHKSLGQPVALR